VLRRALTVFLLISLAVLFALGLGRLLHLRYQEGDVYPAYSSLRADPLGLRALYDALNGMDGISAERNFRLRPELSAAGESTLLYAGFDAWDLNNIPDRVFEAWEELLDEGGRLVIALSPQQRWQVQVGEADDSLRSQGGTVALHDRWNVNWRRQRLGGDHDRQLRASLSEAFKQSPQGRDRVSPFEDQLPGQLEWHSS
jgi:ATP phosphoribosyltransferase regulatory subunit HisZ